MPIDGVGIQAHILSLDTKELSSFAANLERLVKLGLQVHITEMDVGLPTDERGRPRDPEDLKRQAEVYRFVADAWRRASDRPACRASAHENRPRAWWRRRSRARGVDSRISTPAARS